MKKEKILKISIGLLGIVAIILTIGITYAYFGTQKKGNEENFLASSCFNLEFQARNILSENNVPMTDEEAKKLKPYVFIITNTCDTSAEVGLNLDILKSTNATLSNYKISLSDGVSLKPTLIDDLESDDATSDDTLLTKKLMNIYVAGNSQKNIEMRLWLKESVGIGVGHNETIESKISLTATAIPIQLNEVQEKIIADNGGILKIRGQQEEDFTKFSPDYKYKSTSESVSDESIIPHEQYYYSSSFVFDDRQNLYKLIDPKQEPLSEKMNDKYICEDGSKECKTMYKITNCTPHEGDLYIYDPWEDDESLYSYGVKDSFIVGKHYEIDPETLEYIITDPIEASAVTESLVGYYFTDSYTERSWSLLKIKKIEMAEKQEDKYIEKVTENHTLSVASNSNKMVGKSFTFNPESGIYTLQDTTNSVTFSSDYIDYYFCSSNATTCSTLYQIKEITDTTLTKATMYTRVKNENRITLSDGQYVLDYNYDVISGEKYGSEVIDYYRDDLMLHVAQDDLGDSYYFRGGNDKNNIYFAGYYWNIVRINGDGSLRIIYRGTSPTTTGNDSQVDTSYFNRDNGSNAAVGYMFGTPRMYSYRDEHANINNSLIKEKLDLWYENKMITYSDYLADSIFCNDRSVYSGKGFGTKSSDYYDPTSYYYGYDRLNKKSPTLKCSQKNDRFTVSNNYGNKNNKYPVGLITSDEAVYAGMFSGNNGNLTPVSIYNYLNTGIDYWTMTPYGVSGNTYEYLITATGKLSSGYIYTLYGVRPVINLKGNVILSGTGTLEDPYVVEGLKTE